MNYRIKLPRFFQIIFRGFIFILMIFSLTSCSWSWISSCVPVERGAELLIENRTQTDVIIYWNEAQIDHPDIYRYDTFLRLGTVLTQQTSILKSPWYGGISIVSKIYLQAEDTSGKVVWQKSMSGEEFGKLASSGPINFVVSPETSSSQ